MTNTDLMRQRPANTLYPQEKYAAQWMMIAYMMKEASAAVRKKVGASIVTPSMSVFTGYNGTLPGSDNCCEVVIDGELVTHSGVIHAEENALKKMVDEGVNTEGSVIYITLSPCVNCAELIANSGVKAVYYYEPYRCLDGVKALLQRGIHVGTWEEVLGRPFQPLDFWSRTAND